MSLRRSHETSASVSFTGSAAMCVATISGEIDMSNAEAVLAELIGGVDHHRCRHLTIDLSGVQLLGSDGIRALVKLHHHTRLHSCEMSLRNPSSMVRTVLDVTGVGPALGLEPAEPAE